MSYSIIYDKQFIRAMKGGQEVFFPVILGGDNNVYEVGPPRKRARDWYNRTYLLGGKQYGTLEDMLKEADKHREQRIESSKQYKERNPDTTIDDYSDDHYGYHTGLKIRGTKTRFKDYQNLIKDGVKKAMTVEELNKHHISVQLFTSHYAEDKLKEAGLKPLNIFVHTSEELVLAIDKYEQEYKGVDIYISIDASENQMKWLRRELQPRARKGANMEFRDVEEYYVLKGVRGGVKDGYYHSATSRRTRYSYSPSSGRAWESEKEAEKFRKKMNSAADWIVEKIIGKNRIKVKKRENVTAQ